MRRLVAIFFLFIAYESSSQDFSKIAPEYCDCFKTLEDSVHADYVSHIIAASKEQQFSVAFFRAISIHGKEFSSNGMKSWSRLKQIMVDQNSEMGRCAATLDARYYQFLGDDEKRKAFHVGILEELERTGECGFYAAMLRSIYKQNE